MKKRNKYLKLFYEILRIRKIEKSIASNYDKQNMRCPVHLSIGQESIAVGICRNLLKSDEVVTAHRSHAHYLAKGGNLREMIAELHGKVGGCAKGKGGSMHLMDLKANVVAAVPIVGSTIPIGVGKAWANKLKNKKKLVVIFFGDGATEEGVFFESLDFASLHNLRVLFVCENNKYSVYSDLSKRQSSNRSITKIAKAIGIESFKLNDHNLFNVYEKSKKIINRIKKTSKPFLLEIDTYRQVEHCGPNEDDYLKYRSISQISYWKNKDQIENSIKYLLNKNFNSKKIIHFYEKKINKEVLEAFKFALKSKYPGKKELKKHIYKKVI